MDINVRTQCIWTSSESFEAELILKDVADDFVGVFIRAPYIVEAGENVECLQSIMTGLSPHGQGQFLGCSFHPELTDDYRFMSILLKWLKKIRK